MIYNLLGLLALFENVFFFFLGGGRPAPSHLHAFTPPHSFILQNCVTFLYFTSIGHFLGFWWGFGGHLVSSEMIMTNEMCNKRMNCMIINLKYILFAGFSNNIMVKQ